MDIWVNTPMSEDIVTHLDPRSPASEAFRVLRTNLQFSSVDRELKSVLITSAGPGEGKSVVASNLAVAFAQSGKKTVLVDIDLRRPTVHERFGVANREGVSTGIVNGLTEDILVESEIPNLWLLPSGPTPPNPAELLGSQSMKRLVTQLTEWADMVVFDAPPVIAVTDSCVVAPLVDGVVLVVKLGQADRNMTLRAKQLLANVKANIIGAVVNDVDNSTGQGYYYYHYYHDERRTGRP
jgi:capsular exopolysaccharide synthesis family protein